MKTVVSLSCIWLLLTTVICVAGEGLDFEDDGVRLGYSIGYLVGGDFLGQKKDLNRDLLLQGIADAMAGATPRLTPEQMKSTLGELQKAMARKELEQVAKPVPEPQ